MTTGRFTIIDRYLDKAEKSVSLATREMVCRLSLASPNFEKTAENLKHTTGIQTSGETIRKIVEAEGQKVIAAQQKGTLPIFWTAKDCPAEPTDPQSPTRVYLGVDGVQIPVITDKEKQKRRSQIVAKRRGKKGRKPLPASKKGESEKFKEYKLVVAYDESKRHRIVMGTTQNHRHLGRLLKKVANQIELDEAKEKVAIVDGAVWIQKRIEGQNLSLDAICLDIYHLSENVHKARKVVFGESDEAGKKWAEELLQVFREEGYEKAMDRMIEWKKGLRGSKRKAAEGLQNYVSDRREMICYPELRAKGIQIGSGPTEAMCKTVTQRVKGSGKRWDLANAGRVLALQCLEQSGLWQRYWQSHLATAA